MSMRRLCVEMVVSAICCPSYGSPFSLSLSLSEYGEFLSLLGVVSVGVVGWCWEFFLLWTKSNAKSFGKKRKKKKGETNESRRAESSRGTH